MTDLRPLLARLEEAPGRDDELGYDIVIALDAVPERGDPGYPYNVTVSIDASLALVEKKLPGACVGIELRSEDADCYIVGRPFGTIETFAPTAPLAILRALLRALISNQTDPGKDEA